MHASITPGPERRIAIVTTDESALPDIEQFLTPAFQTACLSTWDGILGLMSRAPLDAILLDIDTIAESTALGLDALAELRRIGRDLVLIALTRSHSRSVRLKAGAVGADEFFVAPVDFQELQIVLERALDRRSMEIENRRLREQISQKYSFCELIGGSEPMRRVYDAIRRVAQTNTTVMIRGESGTGKELVARAIVRSSPRAEKPFISVNCGAIPETLIEAELFGHERGSFTGAVASRPGHIEVAHGGTLFLDEIGSLPLALQSKLLRVLEDRAVQRIGAKTAKKIDFRLITATNDDLEDGVRKGLFREDLYYRVHVIPIFLPPLRQRPGDIPLLVDHFLRLYCAANNVPLKRVEPEVLEVLEENPWRGNVRELENLIQRLVLMVERPVITVKDLPGPILYESAARHEDLLIPQEGIDFVKEMERIEAAYLETALRRVNGRKVAAAQLLRIDARKMGYLCRKYKI
ncbi:MAG TPA: sigma-54 dependent transcriptional regulator [Terriglobales bacterium]|nr:sigma-54 dependent transcriptional regulator [Terriglobales bacterium]